MSGDSGMILAIARIGLAFASAADLILVFRLIFEKCSWKHLPAVDRANKINAEQQKNPG